MLPSRWARCCRTPRSASTSRRGWIFLARSSTPREGWCPTPRTSRSISAMGESVRTVLRLRQGTLKPGDVVTLNNPYNGGTHLPDVTVITPVFDAAGRDILFFVANRGHHADIGGITPGSTPPASRTLEEEGVVLDNFLLVDGGEFCEAEFRHL